MLPEPPPVSAGSALCFAGEQSACGEPCGGCAAAPGLQRVHQDHRQYVSMRHAPRQPLRGGHVLGCWGGHCIYPLSVPTAMMEGQGRTASMEPETRAHGPPPWAAVSVCGRAFALFPPSGFLTLVQESLQISLLSRCFRSLFWSLLSSCLNESLPYPPLVACPSLTSPPWQL